MKTKILCLFLSILFVLTLAACGDTPADTTPSGSDSTPGSNIPASNYYRITGDTKMEQGFQLTGKKYTYKNKDCLLVDVENQTDKNYTVSLRVHYFDEEGNEIKSQKQVFTGWAAGYQKYFFFQPSINFAAYTYTLELTEYTGECYAQEYIAAVSSHIKEYKDYNSDHPVEYRALGIRVESKNISTQALVIKGYFIILDKNGDIHFISSSGSHTQQPISEDWTTCTLPYSVPYSEKLVWPEELKGEIYSVACITSVEKRGD